MTIWLGILFVGPDVIQHASLGQRLVRLGVTAAVVFVCDWWFARRMGVTISDEALTLHYAFSRNVGD